MRAETASPGLRTPSRGHLPGLRTPPTAPQRPLTRFLNSAEQQFPGMLFSRGTVLLMISPVLSLPGQKSERGSSRPAQERQELESTGERPGLLVPNLHLPTWVLEGEAPILAKSGCCHPSPALVGPCPSSGLTVTQGPHIPQPSLPVITSPLRCAGPPGSSGLHHPPRLSPAPAYAPAPGPWGMLSSLACFSVTMSALTSGGLAGAPRNRRPSRNRTPAWNLV